jgi:hypothetical protein
MRLEIDPAKTFVDVGKDNEVPLVALVWPRASSFRTH